jgi:hypothetical protein
MAKDTLYETARNELFGFIHQCNVLKATEEQQLKWVDDTLDYLASRHPDLSGAEIEKLRETAIRFCRPVIPYGKTHTALTTEGHGQVDELVGDSR